jgi:beta-lactamase regulating signal transducer with metallopeptidase domain
MNELFVLVAHNTAVAIALAMFVFGLTRVWRNPPVAHLLWLLVLVKLVTPPVLNVDWSALLPSESTPARSRAIADVQRNEERSAEISPRFVDLPTPRASAPATVTNVTEDDSAAGIQLFWHRARPFLFWCWLGGATLCALVATMRIVSFERHLRDTLPAPERLQRLALEIAGKLGVRKLPDVRYVECVEVPLVWCAGRRPTIVLPMRLLLQLDDQQAVLILAHELAHLRRRDHWVRAVELFVSTVHWWNPLVWVIRRKIHQAEDLCCDAWVRWAFPGCTRRYAEVVLKMAESLSRSRFGARLLPASQFLNSFSLKARIEMILENRFAPRVSRRAMFAIGLFALLVMLSFGRTAETGAWAAPPDETPTRPLDDNFLTKRFKYRVPFETGETQTRNGGRIEIREVLGTRPKIEVGGQYLVRGKYVLPAGEHGKLYFYATAGGPWSETASLDLQSTEVDKQEGEFALIHGMAGSGYFHLILTDPEKYSRWFANVYFGTGDNVYREKAKTDSADIGTSEKTNGVKYGIVVDPLTGEARKEALYDDMFVKLYSHPLPAEVRFEPGATRFSDGDQIKIFEVSGTADTFAPGNIYCIKGRYTLASRDRATLAAYTTASDAENANSASLKVQSTVVDRGSGSFTLYLPMSARGWPHVSFYPADGGDSFGGNYFGTGDSVLKLWWGSKETDQKATSARAGIRNVENADLNSKPVTPRTDHD